MTMMTHTCTHEHTRQVSGDRCFVAPVSADENRAAHGGITYTDECVKCGARRSVNQNQGFYELGPFGPSLAERREAERIAAEKARREREATEDAACAAVKVVCARRDEVTIEIDGQYRHILVREIQAAAEQQDNGDWLVPFYRGLLRKVRAAIRD